jgi:hypothetical protein
MHVASFVPAKLLDGLHGVECGCLFFLWSESGSRGEKNVTLSPRLFYAAGKLNKIIS